MVLLFSGFPLSFVTQLFLIPSSRNSVSVLSFNTKQLSSLLSASGFPLTCIIKWLSSLLYHQTVVLSPLSPNGCPPLSSSGYPLSSITRWLSSLLYHQVVVLSPFSPNGCPPLGCPLFSITKWLSFLSPGGCSLSSITKWLSLYPSSYPISLITKWLSYLWLSSLFYHQMVFLSITKWLSSLSPDGCPLYHQMVVFSPLSLSCYPLSFITKWVSSLLNHSMIFYPLKYSLVII